MLYRSMPSKSLSALVTIITLMSRMIVENNPPPSEIENRADLFIRRNKYSASQVYLIPKLKFLEKYVKLKLRRFQ